VVEKKDGSLRLCLDPKDLNKAIKREHYKIPTMEEIVAEFAGKKVFSTLDLKDGYWQIQLDEQSSRITIVYLQHPIWPVPLYQDAVWHQVCQRNLSKKK